MNKRILAGLMAIIIFSTTVNAITVPIVADEAVLDTQYEDSFTAENENAYDNENKESALYSSSNEEDSGIIIEADATDPVEGLNATLSHEDDDIAYGSVGRIEWKIDSSGKLIVVGSGDYANDDSVSFNPWFLYRESITSADINLKNSTNLNYFFYECNNLKTVDLDGLDTSKVTKMDFMFESCYSLESIDLSKFNTKSLVSMNSTFAGCISLKSIDLSYLDTSKVTYMGRLFSGCSSLENIEFGKIDTSSVGSMKDMFFGCSSLNSIDLSKFDTGKVGSTNGMFNSCSSLKSIEAGDIDTKNVVDMTGMFSGCTSLTSIDLSSWNTSKTQFMVGLFAGCSSLESVKMDNLNTTSLLRMNEMFTDCCSLKSIDLSTLKTSKVNSTDRMFKNCSSLEEFDFGKFNTESVQDMSNMFSGCSSLSKVSFKGSKTQNLTKMNEMFSDCSNLKKIDLSGLNSRTVNSMSGMFAGCIGLVSVDLSCLDTSGLENTEYMFDGCTLLEEINVNGINTQMLKDVSGMFSNCKSIKTMDLSCIDLSNVTDSSGMFSYCDGLTELNVSTLGGTLCNLAPYDSLITLHLGSGITKVDDGTFYENHKLKDVYFKGTELEWKQIDFGSGNDNLTNATIHFDSLTDKCGVNVKWSFNESGILTISGTGDMYDFVFDDGENGDVTIPWWDYHTQIKKVVIKEGITNIGDSAFIHHYDLAEVHIPTSVTEIRDSVFYATFVKDIYYDGTKAQWNKIKIGAENESIQNSIMHFDGEPEVSEWPQKVSFSYCNTNYEFSWSPSILLDSKDVINKKLAQISLILSAYSEYSTEDAKTKIDESLKKLGLLSESEEVGSDVTLRRWHVSYGDSKTENRSAAHTIALNEYKDGNKTYKIVTVICRGTQMSELAEDVALDLQNKGFVESAWNTYTDLCGFLENNDINVPDRDVRYYIVGHSLGAATANILTSYLISAGCYSNDITCYTYACPFTTWGYYYAHRNRGNAMNIIKADDAVTLVSNDYGSFVNDVANTINNGNPFYWMLEELGFYKSKEYKAMRFGFDIYLGSVTPKAKEYYKEYTGFSFDSYRPESRDFRDHRCETYMAFLQACIDDGNFARMQKNMRGNRQLSIYCPVNVNVIDNNTGKEVVTIEDNRITSLLDDNIEAIVVGDKKFISLPHGSDYQVLLNGTGEGVLRYVVQEQKEGSGGMILDNTVTFENVSIQLGKEFTSSVNDEIDSEDIRLLVLDENRLDNKEVLENGQEVKYNRFGDVLETDVPVDGTIPDGIWVAGVTDMAFTGKVLTQDFRIYDGTTMLIPKTDYTVKYKNNKKSYTITDPDNLTATDIKKAPQIIITMKGNYSGKETVYFSINPTGENPAKVETKPYSITGDKISITDTSGNSNLSAAYDKSGAKPSIRVMYEDTVLKEGKDYTLKYSGNNKYPAPKASVTITGKGNYTSKMILPITVTQRPFSEGAGITVVAMDKAEGKKAGQYTTTVKVFDSEGKILKAGTDYDKKITYLKDGVELAKTDYPKAGDEITVRVTGKGGYTDNSIETTYNIVPAGQVNDISKATIKINNQPYNKGKSISITDQSMFSQAYIGKNKSPLILSTDGGETGDFMVVPGSYSKNTNKGTAKVTFMGINGYTGTKTVSFSIGSRSLKDIWFGWRR